MDYKSIHTHPAITHTNAIRDFTKRLFLMNYTAWTRFAMLLLMNQGSKVGTCHFHLVVFLTFGFVIQRLVFHECPGFLCYIYPVS